MTTPAGPTPYPPMPKDHPQAVAIIVLGALSMMTGCFPLGIAAWVMGNRALREIDAQPPGTYGNRALVVVGRVLGIVSTLMWVVMLVFLVPAFVAWLGFMQSNALSVR